MTGANVFYAILWALYMGFVFWIVARSIPHDPPKLPPDLEDIRRSKK